MKYSSKTIMVNGYSQLPEKSFLYHQDRLISVTMVIDIETSQILEFSICNVTNLKNRFLASIVNDYYLDKGIEPLLEAINSRAYFPALKALNQALIICYENFLDMR